jgi:GDP-4-dehydro-6-deoxy-D-mannose reductase
LSRSGLPHAVDERPWRVLVTGVSGFVGRHLIGRLRADFPAAILTGALRDPSIADRLPPGLDHTVALDLDAPNGLHALIADVRPDAVIHLAAQSDVGMSFRQPVETWRTNLMGTAALGEALLIAAPEAVLIFSSSGEVYGTSFQANVALGEDAIVAPANPYAASKAAADLAVAEMALRGLRTIRLRPFTHTGPGQAPRYAVAAFARQVARIEAGLQRPVVTTGALDRWRDILDVRDVCRGYIATLETALNEPTRLAPGIAMNLCSGQSRRIGDILAELLELAGVQAEIRQEPALVRTTDIIRVQGLADRAIALVGWSAPTLWSKTIADVLQDWRGRCACVDRASADHRSQPRRTAIIGAQQA